MLVIPGMYVGGTGKKTVWGWPREKVCDPIYSPEIPRRKPLGLSIFT
jgi:hypothetical protein